MMLLAGASATAITGRISMGLQDTVQCGMKYDKDEFVHGFPIAGVDGTTFGALHDSVLTDICGKKIVIDGVIHIVVDRIWQNDGVNGYLYDDKYNADHKVWPKGKGYQQIDTAQFTYWQRGGNQDLQVYYVCTADCGNQSANITGPTDKKVG